MDICERKFMKKKVDENIVSIRSIADSIRENNKRKDLKDK